MHIEVIHNSKSIASESFRTLRSTIQFSNFGQSIQTIVVTSSNPNEGKSEVSINLVASLAQQGKRVLLIDADMRKPTQHKIIEVMNTEGLSKFLLRETGAEAIHVLTSGPVPPNPSEMLASMAMEQSIKAFVEYYDYVIIDTPPLLAATDAQVLARIADATLLVVDPKQSKRRQIVEAKKRLDNVGARLLGTVMNKLKLTEGNNYYYYYKY